MFAFNSMIFMSYLFSLSVDLDSKILVFDHLCVLDKETLKPEAFASSCLHPSS